MGDPNFPKSKLTDRDSGAIGKGGDKVSLFEILTFEQQRFACDFGKRVGKTVSEIKSCREARVRHKAVRRDRDMGALCGRLLAWQSRGDLQRAVHYPASEDAHTARGDLP
jgi:hypothetical protein